ncbi:MAG: glycoside hydrolase, family 20 [Acidimicrobiales bacterium]|nr:glycoside hydrolase, family 20 [Acidimicrobiales bacterium]
MNLLPLPRRVDVDELTLVPAGELRITIDDVLPPQGYRMWIRDRGVDIDAGDEAGAFYAGCTLDQLLTIHGGRLPVGAIEDWPDLPVRGVMLDISRDKVPTLETVMALVERLASWKVNHVELYMEHTFRYTGHTEVWAEASPFSALEIRQLDEFCRDRHVELTPNQNCLGHWERWLKFDEYRPLALSPGGFTDQRGRHRAPTTIDPTNPGALALVRELLAQLLPNFTSPRMHVGLDEPWELPAERIDDYLAWLTTLRSLPELDGREMLVWGDILAARPDRLARVPDGVTICEWGYDDWHPFDERCAAYAAAGVPFWVAPGTSSWLTILGRWTNMMGDNRVAAEAAVAHGGRGFLNTDWGDQGHLQYLPVSEPGFAYGAAVSWCLESNRDLDLEAALSVHAFGDPTGEIGAALHRLADVHTLITPQFPNMSTLVAHLYFPQMQVGRTFTEGLTAAELDRVDTALDEALAELDRARPARADGPLVLDELRAGAAIVRLAVHDARARITEGDGWLASVPEWTRLALADELAPLIDEHRRLWLARNRPGGLDDSCAWLHHVLECYRSGEAPWGWGGW